MTRSTSTRAARKAAVLGTMAALAAGTIAIAPATAQDRYYDYDNDGYVEASYDASMDDGITVRGEPVYRSHRGGSRFEQTLTTHQRVNHSDLDLNYAEHRDVLRSRVAYAADIACDRLDRASDSWDREASDECRRDARRSARSQVRAAINDSYYGRTGW